MRIQMLHLEEMDERYLVYEHYLNNKGETNAKAREEMAKYLTKCIEHGLTEKQKICFTMIVLDARKQKDVAEELGLDQSTVSRHVSAAKRKLRKYSEFFEKTRW